MELVSKLKEMIPWRKKSVETHEVVSLRDDINRLFDRFLASAFDTEWQWPSTRRWAPDIDLEETDDEVIVRAEVPGLDPKKLDISIRDDMLQMRYEQEERRENGGYAEHRYGSFSRTISLPDGLETSEAKASCKHGLLTIRIPWTREAKERTRRIPITVS